MLLNIIAFLFLVCRSSQNQRLLHLSQSANSCKKVLNDKLEVARRVIQLNELSRKMETVQEQVLPFEGPQGINEDVQFKGPDVPTEQEAAHSPSHHAESPSHHKKHNKHHNANLPAPHQSSTWQADNTTPVMPPDRLANFYRRYNKILLDNVAISKEKERLSLENAQLQDLIQQYIQGTQLSDETLANDNPLFVVNGR